MIRFSAQKNFKSFSSLFKLNRLFFCKEQKNKNNGSFFKDKKFKEDFKKVIEEDKNYYKHSQSKFEDFLEKNLSKEELKSFKDFFHKSKDFNNQNKEHQTYEKNQNSNQDYSVDKDQNNKNNSEFKKINEQAATKDTIKEKNKFSVKNESQNKIKNQIKDQSYSNKKDDVQKEPKTNDQKKAHKKAQSDDSKTQNKDDKNPDDKQQEEDDTQNKKEQNIQRDFDQILKEFSEQLQKDFQIRQEHAKNIKKKEKKKKMKSFYNDLIEEQLDLLNMLYKDKIIQQKQYNFFSKILLTIQKNLKTKKLDIIKYKKWLRILKSKINKYSQAKLKDQNFDNINLENIKKLLQFKIQNSFLYLFYINDFKKDMSNNIQLLKKAITFFIQMILLFIYIVALFKLYIHITEEKLIVYDFENFLFQSTQQPNFQQIQQNQPQQAKILSAIVENSNNKSELFDHQTNMIYVTDIENMLFNLDILQNSTKENLKIQMQEKENSFFFQNYAPQIIKVLFFSAFFFFVVKQIPQNLSSANSKQKSSQFMKNLGITFKDVAGMQQVKQEMQEFVEFLKNPEKFQKLGAVMPKGALLSGPPGTGKTFLGKAIAGESNVPFFYVAGSEFIEKFVGVGAQRIRELFKEAKKKSPSIIFIDELDAIASKRDGFDSHDEHQNTLNQLLVEMDGFDTKSDVIVLGSTNLPSKLDPAILRPGRLDRTIEVNLPSIEEREAIFLIYLDKIKLNPVQTKQYYSKRLSTLTPGFSGADIKNVVNEAAIIAVRSNKSLVDDDDFEEAVEKVIGGIERKGQSLEENKQTVAVHEAGHGVVSWFLEGGDPLLKVTIKPRSKGALGFAQYLPNESNLQTKQELLDKIASILAGRCAEIEFFGKSSTGAHDDFQKAKNIAFEIVTTYGMSEDLKFVPFLLDEYGNQYYSEKTHLLIDNAVEKIIKEQTQRCMDMVKLKKNYIKDLSDKLLEKQVLIFTDIVQILGDRPFKPKQNFERFLQEIKKNKQNLSTV